MILSYVIVSLFPTVLVEALRTRLWPTERVNFESPTRHSCKSEVYCQGLILATIQEASLFEDGKHFVDMPGRFSEEQIKKNFARLGPRSTKGRLRQFIHENFHRPGWDLRIVIPKDWKADPAFLKRIKDEQLLQFAKIVHSKWKVLVRAIYSERIKDGNLASTTVGLPYPFVVPGGRFRELYYWDSFWIIEGLIVSEMCLTAKAMIENFKWLIETFGFIPNGSRRYYLNRSHPPLFAMMFEKFLNGCVPPHERQECIAKALPFLDQEYLFWNLYRNVTLFNPRDPARPYTLTIYSADTDMPRPESYNQDLLMSQSSNSTGMFFKHVATAAESGWDFSMRWLENPFANLTSLATANIIPVDLNAIMYKNEQILKGFHDIVGNPQRRDEYDANAKRRLEAMNVLLRSEKGWFDFDFKRNRSMSERPFVISNYAPFWSLEHLDTTVIQDAINREGKLLFEYPGGAPNNLIASGQQWDFPNVWAPIQYNMIDLYLRLAQTNSTWREKALNLAQRFINATYCGYQNYGNNPQG